MTFECCGVPMVHAEVFGIWVYRCQYRPRHPKIYVSPSTGGQLSEADFEWLNQED